MGKVAWTEGAKGDVEAIFDYIAKNAPRSAVKFISELVRAPSRLANAPRSGRRVPEFQRHEFREVVFKKYRIVYVIRGETCFIAAVVHGRRKLSSRLTIADLEDIG